MTKIKAAQLKRVLNYKIYRDPGATIINAKINVQDNLLLNAIQSH